MSELPAELREGLRLALDGLDRRALTDAVRRLVTGYRSAEADTPVLNSSVEVAAYAAYRMPATYAAALAALLHGGQSAPELAPATLLDVGGGTGALAWAAAEVFPTLAEVTVVDRSLHAAELGGRLASAARSPAVRAATWNTTPLGQAVELPAADLATACYLLGELTPDEQTDLVARMSKAAPAVVLIEPGTPRGYGRILDARQQLLDAGFSVRAPCPHQAACPVAGGSDWCHFATRINRSAIHRQLKEASLGYEDEKYSYLVATAAPATVPPTVPATARVIARPRQRSGLVELALCTPAGAASREVVSKRTGDRYRAAKRLRWGDAWS